MGLTDAFVADLKEAVVYARSKHGEPAGSSALYGVAGTDEGNRMVNDLLCGVFDYMYGCVTALINIDSIFFK
jgi:hypothetical protein